MPTPWTSKISRVIVLMLENRSFDHMLGFANLVGQTPDGTPTRANGLRGDESNECDGKKYTVTSDAPSRMPKDPPHEFRDVRLQLCGDGDYPSVTMGGFVRSYGGVRGANPGDVMRCFAPARLPVLTTLAREFAVCDAWFSSTPGPTWPNRFFAHAATSGLLYDSPSRLAVIDTVFGADYHFKAGSLFDQLDKKKVPWRLYHGSRFPQVFALGGMNWQRLQYKSFSLGHFDKDIQKLTLKAKYVFIEPDYGSMMFGPQFEGGSSQHPVDDVRGGEALIKSVYESVRRSPLWPETLLVITYDEHGGFYDHVPPPAARPPGDVSLPIGSPGTNGAFQFNQYGVRVPAVVISPWIEPGTIDHTLYEHASIPATVERLFGLAPMTVRDAHANDLGGLLVRDQPRLDAIMTLPAPPPAQRVMGRALAVAAQVAPPTATQMAFAQLALKYEVEAAGDQAGKKDAAVRKFVALRTAEDAGRYLRASDRSAGQTTRGAAATLQPRTSAAQTVDSIPRSNRERPTARLVGRPGRAASGKQQSIATLLRDARRTQRLTTAQLAKRIGTTKAVVERFERGNGRATIQLVDRIARALGMTFQAAPQRVTRDPAAGTTRRPAGTVPRAGGG